MDLKFDRNERTIMKTMSEAQKVAITHKQGPMLVLAGPGSGKTLVITRRTKYLIEECGVNPARILVITFTKAAAEEMKERFFLLMGRKNLGVNFGTFHAVFFKILRYAYNYDASNIISDEQKYRYFREILNGLEIEIEDEKDFIEGISSEISLVKGEKMDIANYYSMNCSEEDFQRIYKAYEKKLRSANLIDFDDMLLLCYELLVARKDILSLWQQKYEYILIDEFQDINKIQYDIVRLLARPQDNLFIVGDDDQSIYRFRGAKPEIMLRFSEDYKNAKRVLLDYNYRSKGKIVEGALRVVKNNTNRYEKEIKAIHEPGSEIETIVCKDLPEENQAVLDLVMQYRKKGLRYGQIAILYRTNTQPGALVERFMEYNVPFRMRDGIPNIYEHWITKNMIAYIKLAMGCMDRELFFQVINRPKRYIARDCFTEPTVDLNKIKEYYGDKKYVVERIEKLEYDLALLRKTNPFAAITYIRRAIGYDDYLREYAEFRRMKVEELYDLLSELQEGAREFKSYEEWFLHMEEYKEELKRQVEQKLDKSFDGVALSTFHASKGLEYDVVIIIDANEGITPHRKAILPEDLEEERRMFYVAMTRAKDKLHIYSVKERFHKELACSRFVGELLMDQSVLRKGARVEHKMYGEGVVIENKNGKLSIKFDKIVLPKTLDIDFCIQNQLLISK